MFFQKRKPGRWALVVVSVLLVLGAAMGLKRAIDNPTALNVCVGFGFFLLLLLFAAFVERIDAWLLKKDKDN